MLRLLVALLPTLRSAMLSRRNLVVENLALRQQLVTLVGRRRPDIRPADRVFWILLLRLWSGWSESLAIVRPDTVVRWHRPGFRIYWNWLSRRGKRSGRPELAPPRTDSVVASRTPMFGHPLLASAAMDRLLHHAHVLVIEGDSFRNPPPNRKKKAQAAAAA